MLHLPPPHQQQGTTTCLPRNIRPTIFYRVWNKSVTPPKTNMFPDNQWLEDAFPIEIVSSEGTDLLVLRGVCWVWPPHCNSGK